MDITFKKTDSDLRRLTKHFVEENGTEWSQTFTINNTDNIDLINPTVSIAYQKTVNNTTITFDTTANYAIFNGRYYFINNITLGTGGKVYINMTVDVLMTYADGIKNAPCCITRSANENMNWVTDTKYPLNPNVKDFSKSLYFGGSEDYFTGTDTYFTELAEFSQYTFPDPNNNGGGE